ncbi:MAG: NUDIX domain-containing protein [Candidatus Methylacidiphilales bacterium]|nr:NUDIX domain-containing protein [Candidatus Methylacidiphilales bacterium]
MQQHTHLGIYGVIIAEGRIALILKTRGPYTGCWDLPGGTMEFGESPEQTLEREILEETGLTLEPEGMAILSTPSVRFTYQRVGQAHVDFHHLGILYRCSVADKDALRRDIQCEDVGEARWFTLEDAADVPLTPFARGAVHSFRILH